MTPWAGFRADAEGLVLLTTDRAEAYSILAGLGSIVAEDERHANERRRIERPFPIPPISVVRREACNRAA